MMRRWSLAIAFLLLALPARLAAQTAMDAFERGNTAYREGRFEDAVRAYELILGQGIGSVAVYYNLGNAYYRLGKIGPAILAYERALRMDPGDRDAAVNLRMANFRTVDRIEPLPEFFLVAWLRGLAALLPLRVTGLLFLAVWWMLFLSLAGVYLLLPSFLKRPVRWTAFVSALLAILLGSILVLQLLEAGGRDDAVIVTPVVTVRSSPDPQSTDAFVVHEGLKVRVSDAVGEWAKVTLADGKEGWILKAQCELI